MKRNAMVYIITGFLLLSFSYSSTGLAQEPNFTFEYDVGPGQPLATPSDVPWETLQPGTLIRIHYRDTPYNDKWVIAVSATAQDPVVIRGIPEGDMLPVITGENAQTRQALDYWNEDRSVIKIGGSSHPSAFPSHITIENLEIRSARPPYIFSDDHGTSQTYRENAACIHIEMGNHITIRNCTLHDSGNGLFSGHQSSDILVENSYVHSNGIDGSIYHHNSYTESLGITFQYNHYGPLRSGCRGNNLKDRSAGTVIRYNWIEAGNRTLDLVESDHTELYNDPSYTQTLVYGNILIKHDVIENGQVLHYGGDGGDTNRYRKGTLWFYNNTVISYRSGNTTLLGLSSNDEYCQCFNSIVYVTATGNRLAIMGERGDVNLHHNWLKEGWRSVHGTLEGNLTISDNVEGLLPGFTDFAIKDFTLDAQNNCIDQGDDLPVMLLPEHDLDLTYAVHQGKRPRYRIGPTDIGAFEYKEVFNIGLAVDFGTSGLWDYDGSWSKLSNWDPDDDLAGWSGGLAVDFGSGRGLWNHAGASWNRLSNWDADGAGLAGWSGGLAVDFNGNGLWNNDGSSWSKLSNWDPDSDVVGCLGGLWVDFGGNGVWNNDGSLWNRITTWDVDNAGLACWNGGLAADFDDNGLWNYDSSSWNRLSNWDPEDDLAGWPGGLAVDFGIGRGLWNNDGTSWSRLSNWDPEGMTGVADGLVVGFGANGVWKYDGSSWSRLSNWNAENMADCDLN